MDEEACSGGGVSTVGVQKRRWRGGVSRGNLGALDGSDMPEHAQVSPASPLGIRTPTLLYNLRRAVYLSHNQV